MSPKRRVFIDRIAVLVVEIDKLRKDYPPGFGIEQAMFGQAIAALDNVKTELEKGNQF